MDSLVNEIYAEDGKKLLDLVQEWIDENISYLYCKSNETDAEYSCRW